MFRLRCPPIDLTCHPIPNPRQTDSRQAALRCFGSLLFTLSQIQRGIRIVRERLVGGRRDVTVIPGPGSDTVFHVLPFAIDGQRRHESHPIEFVILVVSHRDSIGITERDAIAADVLFLIRVPTKRNNFHVVPGKSGFRQVLVDPLFELLSCLLEIRGDRNAFSLIPCLGASFVFHVC